MYLKRKAKHKNGKHIDIGVLFKTQISQIPIYLTVSTVINTILT